MNLRNFDKKFFRYVGPAFLISMAILDPGNISGDIALGQKTGFRLLWLLVVAGVLCYEYQSIAIKLGVYTGKDLASLCKIYYSRSWCVFLWAMSEIALLAADTQEVLGTAIALKLLFGINVYSGIVLSLIAAFGLLQLQQYKQQLFEAVFGVFILIMAVCFAINFFSMDHSYTDILIGLLPFMKISDLPYGVSMLGAVLMPQNLFLHSALVLTRKHITNT